MNSCPDPNIMSNFEYNKLSGVAEATLFSMFKFPESNRVHFQCDILVCKGPCKKVIDCENEILQAEARSLEPKADALLQSPEDGALMASYSVFVLEPGEKVGTCVSKIYKLSKYLTVILFLQMLLPSAPTATRIPRRPCSSGPASSLVSSSSSCSSYSPSSCQPSHAGNVNAKRRSNLCLVSCIRSCSRQYVSLAFSQWLVLYVVLLRIAAALLDRHTL